MSLDNPYGLNAGWKVDPDGRYNRSPGTVTTRMMTDEEKLKYSIAEKVEVEDMDRKLTKGKLVELCTEHGFGKKAYKEIAEILGATPHNVECTVSRLGVRKIVEGDGIARPAEVIKEIVPEEKQALSEQEVSAINSHEEHVDNAEVSVNERSEESIKKNFGLPSDLPFHDNSDEQYKIFIEANKPVIQIHPKTKYYIATGYPHKDRAEQLANIISAAGGEITCDWWKYEKTKDEDLLNEIANAEFVGIRDCDVFISLLPGYCGTYSEIGAAVILGKRVIIHAAELAGYGEEPAPCYYRKNVTRLVGSELQLVAEILKGA